MVSGIITEEAREANLRTGFKIRNLETGDQGRLAGIAPQEGPKVGKYGVNTRDLERVEPQAWRTHREVTLGLFS